eukprot:5799868-Amphidinium_carterae.1
MIDVSHARPIRTVPQERAPISVHGDMQGNLWWWPLDGHVGVVLLGPCLCHRAGASNDMEYGCDKGRELTKV